MTGQIAGPSMFSLELVGLIVGISMIVGAVDLIRQPGWAWKRAEESKVAYLILVLLLPLVGLGMYLFKARPKVAAIAAAGRAASLPFERFGDDADQKPTREDRLAGRDRRPPVGFGSFGEVGRQRRAGSRHRTGPDARARRPTGRDRWRSASTFFSSRGTATTHPSGPDRPGPGLPAQAADQPRRVHPDSTEARPTVPAGWKADPTGRHQFRYWDGFQWTENVADAGEQSQGRGQLVAAGGARRPAGQGDQPAEPGHQHLEHGLTGQPVAPRRSRSAWASSWMARAIRAVPNRRDWASAFLAGKALRSPRSSAACSGEVHPGPVQPEDLAVVAVETAITTRGWESPAPSMRWSTARALAVSPASMASVRSQGASDPASPGTARGRTTVTVAPEP